MTNTPTTKDIFHGIQEKFLLITRKHWFVLAIPLFAVFFTSAILAGLSLFISFIIPSLALQFYVAITGLFVILTFSLTFITKIIVDWYCHLYIVTTKKIMEVYHTPLSTLQINEVLLDKVRCTEVDVKVNGLINEVIDVGDVVVTFDRPTHQEEFTLENIKDPQSVALFLSDVFDQGQEEKGVVSWYRDRGKEKGFLMREDISYESL